MGGVEGGWADTRTYLKERLCPTDHERTKVQRDDQVG